MKVKKLNYENSVSQVFCLDFVVLEVKLLVFRFESDYLIAIA